MTDQIKSDLNTALSLQFGVISGAKLTAWENSFLDDFRVRWDRYGDKTAVSEKQAAVIARIAAKAA